LSTYDNKDKEMQRPSEEELTKQRLESYRLSIKSEKRDAVQSLTTSLIILIILKKAVGRRLTQINRDLSR